MTSVVVEKNVEAKMRDGTILRSDIYRPAQEGRYPVLVQRTPYNKELLSLTGLNLDPIRAALSGYAVAIQDVRARWRSDGDVFHMYRDEFEDGYDTVEWASELPFCDGGVGVYGVSYMGAATWHAASTSPPALKAIAPTTAPNDFFSNGLFRYGAFLLGTMTTWALQAIGPSALTRSKMGSKDLVPLLIQLVDDADDFEKWVRHQPIRDFPPARPDDSSFIPFFFDVLDHPTRDSFSDARSVSDRHSSISVPALIIAGWHDLLLKPDLDHYRSMCAEAATDEAREKTKLVVGPWSHGMFLNVVGELDFGLRSSGIFLDLKEDLTGLHLRWFDRWLKGVQNGIDEEPRVKLFVQGINRWRDEDDWPLARAESTPWYLHHDGGLSPVTPHADVPTRSYVYDPNDPCPTLGGTLLMPRTYTAGPVDQTKILGRHDVLSFTSEPLTEDMEVTGPVSAVLFAASSAPDTDWVVKLCDVHPSGRTFNVCDGILRASYRESLMHRTPLVPDSIERYEIDLWATSMVFKAGHRIRLVVTSSDFPRYDRNPNTGELGIEAIGGRPAMQTIFMDANRASHVLLPVVS